MADKSSLLSFIARRHTVGREDVATSALSYILSHSKSARCALSCLLSNDGPRLKVAKVAPWGADAVAAIPDLACLDENDNLVALIESKFWAPLARHQPVTYWEGIPADRPSVLLFLAPKYRIDRGYLWAELRDRLRVAGHELGPTEKHNCLVVASATGSERRLMLASWDLLLDRLAQKARKDRDCQASFEIAELRGLACDVSASENPRHDENLKKLIARTVKCVVQSGWANTDGLTVGQGFEFYGRYLRLAGAIAWFGIDYKALRQDPAKPLWRAFMDGSSATVSVEAVRKRLGELIEPGFVWSGEKYACVPIPLPDGVDTDATCNAIAAELVRIAKLIDRDGPTYQAAQCDCR